MAKDNKSTEHDIATKIGESLSSSKESFLTLDQITSDHVNKITAQGGDKILHLMECSILYRIINERLEEEQRINFMINLYESHNPIQVDAAEKDRELLDLKNFNAFTAMNIRNTLKKSHPEIEREFVEFVSKQDAVNVLKKEGLNFDELSKDWTQEEIYHFTYRANVSSGFYEQNPEFGDYREVAKKSVGPLAKIFSNPNTKLAMGTFSLVMGTVVIGSGAGLVLGPIAFAKAVLGLPKIQSTLARMNTALMDGLEGKGYDTSKIRSFQERAGRWGTKERTILDADGNEIKTREPGFLRKYGGLVAASVIGIAAISNFDFSNALDSVSNIDFGSALDAVSNVDFGVSDIISSTGDNVSEFVNGIDWSQSHEWSKTKIWSKIGEEMDFVDGLPSLDFSSTREVLAEINSASKAGMMPDISLEQIQRAIPGINSGNFDAFKESIGLGDFKLPTSDMGSPEADSMASTLESTVDKVSNIDAKTVAFDPSNLANAAESLHEGMEAPKATPDVPQIDDHQPDGVSATPEPPKATPDVSQINDQQPVGVSATPEPTSYKVQSGDALERIAKQILIEHGIENPSLNDQAQFAQHIADTNGIDVHKILPGQELKVNFNVDLEQPFSGYKTDFNGSSFGVNISGDTPLSPEAIALINSAEHRDEFVNILTNGRNVEAFAINDPFIMKDQFMNQAFQTEFQMTPQQFENVFGSEMHSRVETAILDANGGPFPHDENVLHTGLTDTYQPMNPEDIKKGFMHERAWDAVTEFINTNDKDVAKANFLSGLEKGKGLEP